jgi:CheY-like chemotaxis protein
VTEKAKILLVDDRPENLLALEAILSSLDQTLVRAGSGEDALKALLSEDFAVVLLDVQMPGMDGFETASHIKRREKTKDLPIIFLTAIDKEPQHAFRGYAAGAADYLAKPFDPWVLRAKVQVFVDLWAKGRQLEEQASLLRERLDAATSRPARVTAGVGGGAGAAEAGADEGPGAERGTAAAADGAGIADVASGVLLVEALSERVEGVEELVEVLGSQARVSVDPAMAETVAELKRRVAKLRSTLLAFAAH